MNEALDEILKSLSLEELLTVRDTVEERINRARRAEQNAAKKNILELAELYGIEVSLQEPASKSTLPPKYKHPEDANKTWPGRGKKPAWLEALIAKGHQLEEFLIHRGKHD